MSDKKEVNILPREKLFGEHLIYDSTQISEIEEDENYLYYIRLTTEFLHPAFDRHVVSSQQLPEKNQSILNACRTQCDLPSFVKDDINSGRAKLVLDYSTEGYWDIDWEWVTKILEINEDRIIWLTALYNFADCDKDIGSQFDVTINKTSAEVRYNALWEQIVVGLIWGSIDGIKEQLHLIDNLHERPLMALTYNRRPHPHRIALLGILHHHNELDNMIWSWGGVMTDRDGINNLSGDAFAEHITRQTEIQELHPWVGHFVSPTYNSSVDIILQTPEHSYDEDLSINKAFDMNYLHIHDTYYQVITETLYAEPGIFLSEKSYKPFISCQPFVICGQHHTVDVLRQQGYDVYDKWINHDYDAIIDNKKRMTVLRKEISRLNTISHKEWAKMMKEMLPTIKKNLKHLMDSYDKEDVISFNYSDLRTVPQELIDIVS